MGNKLCQQPEAKEVNVGRGSSSQRTPYVLQRRCSKTVLLKTRNCIELIYKETRYKNGIKIQPPEDEGAKVGRDSL